MFVSLFSHEAVRVIEISQTYWLVNIVWQVHRSDIPERRTMDDTKGATRRNRGIHWQSYSVRTVLLCCTQV